MGSSDVGLNVQPRCDDASTLLRWPEAGLLVRAAGWISLDKDKLFAVQGGCVSGGGRRTRPWGDLRGSSPEANAVATVLRQWLDHAGLRVDDVRERLTPEHFTSGRIPSRSALSDRLAGVGLQQDFVEAIADVCSRGAADRDRLLRQAADARQNAVRSANSGANSSVAAVELVVLQQRSLEVSDKLVRAMERATQLERERNEANQMVLVLLAMVDKLHRDIAALGRERDRIRSSSSLHTELQTVHERLTRSEQQRVTAESELERAHAERYKADQLAEEAAEQVRMLTAELERLRGEVPTPDASNSAQVSAAAIDLQGAVDQSADDMDIALLKAARHLDDSADRLDQLATELHLDNQPDNPAASNDVSDNLLDIPEHASGADAAIGAHGVLMDTLITLARDQGHEAESAAEALREEDLFSTVRERAVRGGYEMEEVANILNQVHTNRTLSPYDALYASTLLHTIGMTVKADQLLADVVDTVEAAELPALTRTLRAGGRAAQLYRVLSGVAQTWNAPHIVAAVTGMRSHGQPADAFQMLSAVARDSPPDQVLNVTQQLAEDTEWILDAACRDRPVPELLILAGAFEALRPDLAYALQHAYRERQGEGSTSHTVYRAGTQERSSEDLAAPPPTVGDTVAARRDLLPLDTVVRTSAVAMKFANDGRQQALYRLCAEPHSIGQIARYGFMSIYEAQVLVTDLVGAGLLVVQLEPLPSRDLESGDLVDLPPDVAAGTIAFGLGWEASNSDLVPDVSALALIGDSASDDHFIFYNHLKAPDLSIVHLGAASGTGDQVSILVNVIMLPTDVTRVIFTLSLYDSDPPNRSLGSVEHPYIRIATAGGREIGRHELSPPSASDTAVICGVLEKHVGGWTFIAGGRGYTEGLREVALDHGLAVTGGDVRPRNRLSDIFRRVPRPPRT